jgi:NTE family protein
MATRNGSGNGGARNGRSGGRTRVGAALPRVNLALQGGGSHGAFTWGVLDALLEDRRLDFEGISGASAGAMNAVVLAEGWRRALELGSDPRESARAHLAKFCARRVSVSTRRRRGSRRRTAPRTPR